MPIYMDRHDVSEEVTAEIVADLHQKDLQIQHLFNCTGMTYWFDDKRKTAFCLVDAPNKEAIQKMHDYAHGVIPHRIIEVDASVVESFLGRIEDPKKSRKTALNIINDPAFRTIMVSDIKRPLRDQIHSKRNFSLFKNLTNAISDTIREYNGRLVRQKSESFLASFDSVTNAVLCAIKVQEVFSGELTKRKDASLRLDIGLGCGIPVSEKEGIFEETIQTAQRLCDFVQGGIVVTSQVKDLYESENLNIAFDGKIVTAISESEENFLRLFMDFTEKEWNNPALTVDDFSKNLGYSKSQLYRKTVSLTGSSPNSVLKSFRLKKALEFLQQDKDNISGIAYETGFATPAYFSKCFQKAYGMLPSVYAKTKRQ